MSDVVIIDADCLKFLEDAEHRRRVIGSLRTAGFTIQPTLINLAEIAKSENRFISERSYRTVAALARDVGLLPLPHEILHETAAAFLRGDSKYVPERISPEIAIDDTGAVSAGFRDAARQYTDPLNAARTAHFTNHRTAIRRDIKKRKIRIPPVDEFLDRHWRHNEALLDYATIVWEEFGIGQFPGLDAVLSIPAWRLFLEAEGHAVYERLVMPEQPPQTAGFVDLSQILYLAAGRRGILVTNDKGLLRAGTGILRGRYPSFVARTYEEFAGRLL